MTSRRAGNKKSNLVAIRTAATATTGVLLAFYPPPGGVNVWMGLAWGAYLVSTVAYAAIPARLYSHRRFDLAFGGLEILLLGWLLAPYVANESWTFYCLFLLGVLLAALARRLVWALGMGASVSAVYALLSFEMVGFDPGLLILQTTLLMTTVGIVGYLTEELSREEETTALLDNALEVSTLLADVFDTEEVYERLTELLARLFRASRVAVILTRSGQGTARVAAAVDRGSRVSDLTIDLDRYPEIQTALRRRSPVVIDQARGHPEMADVQRLLPARAANAAILVVPILDDDEPGGVLLVRLEDERHAFTAHEIKFCRIMADAAGRALQRAEHYAEIAEAARRDSLTGLYNVRVFHRRLDEEVQRADRSMDALSLVLLDVDYLKHVNDTYGHLAGDRVIRDMAEALQGEVRTVDTVARYGGEEFVVLLPGTAGDRALVVAERLRKRVARVTHEGIPDPVTVSVGIATYPEDAASPTELLHKVDQALYASKNRGRNRCTLFSEMDAAERAESDLGTSDPEDVFLQITDVGRVAALRAALAGMPAEPGGEALDLVARLAPVVADREPESLEEMREIATIADIFLGQLPLGERQRWEIHLACLLHDVGRMALVDGLAEGDEELSREAYRLVRQHPLVGARVLQPIAGFEAVVPMIRHHLERWDGKGHPDGLRGEDVPFGARVVALVEAFHESVRRRPYSDRSRGLRYACREIRRDAGARFDPEMTDRFLFVVDANRDILVTLVDHDAKAEPEPAEEKEDHGDLVAELGAREPRSRASETGIDEDRPTDERASAGGTA